MPSESAVANYLIVLLGLVSFALFFWYFAAEEAKKKRRVGTILTFLLTGFGAYVMVTGDMKKGIDLGGGAAFTVKVVPAEGRTVTMHDSEAAKDIIEKRLAPLGNKDIIATVQGKDTIYVEVPGVDPEEIKKTKQIIEQVAKIEFRLVHPESSSLIAQRKAEDSLVIPGYAELLFVGDAEKDKDGKDIKKEPAAEDLKLTREEQAAKRDREMRKEKKTMLVNHTPEMSGKSVKEAFAMPQMGTGNWEINVRLHSEFGDQMRALTKKNINKPMAIIVDREVISAPTIRGEFGDNFQITGGFTQKEAVDLASALSNPLENPLHILQYSTTSPTYGQAIIHQGVMAGVAGLIVTLIFMVIYYRLAGLIAVTALGVNLLLLLAAMIIFDFTLTMPGIAGTLLTLGIAIDANILIYERMREEFKSGKAFGAAVSASYSKAFSAIFDAHTTSLITSIIMIAIASGAVKGFGVTLTIGIVASLFTALLITRVSFSWLENFGLKKLSFLQLISNRYIDFMGKRKFCIVLSAVLVAGSLALMFIKGEKSLGYELRGGGVVELKGVTEDQVNESLRDLTSVTVGGATESFTYTMQSVKPLGDENPYVNVRTKPYQGEFAKAELQKDLSIKDADISLQDTGPVVGAAALKSSMWAILLGLLGIFIYLAFRYEVPFAIGGIVALTHDVIVAAGFCVLFGREIGMILIGAFLTIAGYSINDTIVIFDRVREQLRTSKADLATVMNEAISATLSRTVLTSGVTMIVLISMLLFGGPSMTDFSLAMLIGIIVGTYSTVFIASPVVLWWAQKHKLNLQKAILDADLMKLEAMSGIEKEAPEQPDPKALPAGSK